MKAEEVIELGRKMRELQRRYFRDRTQGNLQESKDAERRFDAALAELSSGTTSPGLFDGDAKE